MRSAAVALFSLLGFFALTGPAQAEVEFERAWAVGAVPSGLDLDAGGNTYVTTNNQIISFDPQGEEITRWGGPGSGNGQFTLIGGITVDRTDGLIYATDSELGIQRIQKFFLDGGFIQKWGVPGAGLGQLNRPQGIAAAPDGTLYTAEQSNHRIQHFGDAGTPLNLWGSRGFDDNQLESPRAIAIGPNGHVFVGDRAGFIREFDANGGFIRRFGGQDPTPVDGLDDGRFGFVNGAYALAVDSAGLIYAVDRDYDRIQVFRPNGTFLTKFGTTGSGAGEFDAPMDIAIDSTGRVHIAERNNNRVQVFSGTAIAPPQPDEPDAKPNNRFTFGKKTANPKTGIVVLRVRVPGAGQVQLLASKGTRPAAVRSRGKSTVKLQVRAKGKALRTLRQRKRLAVEVKVRFTPNGGLPRTRKTRVNLALR